MKHPTPGPAARERLGRARPFSKMGPEVVDRIFSCMRERRYRRGETLIRQGDEGDCLLVLLQGTVRVDVRDPAGESHEVGRAGPGEVLGELALLTREKRSADVVAESAVHALTLSAGDFDGLALRHPELGILLTHLVAERLGQTARDGLGGKRVGRYRIRRCVGRGGMAIVYEAEDLDSGRTVALKMMSHRLLYEPDVLTRFRREADIAATLHHENIAEMYGRFQAYNTWFLVIEFCDGPTLADVILRHGGLAETQVRAILGQLARALVYIHARNVVHRDLKPGNVMLTRDGVVKLMDFGLARPPVRPLDEQTVTRPGIPIGTPVYMAPEQLFAEDCDARVDIYALACIAYELLTGRHCFRGMSFRELVTEKLSPQLPAAQDIGGGISDEMYAVLEQGLRSRKEERLAALAAVAAWAAPVDDRVIGTPRRLE